MLLGRSRTTNHLRIAALLDDGTALSFVDQRTFGGWMLADLVDVDGSRGARARRAHRPRSARPALRSRRGGDGVAAQALRDQAAAAGPDGGLRHRQHLRRRGAVAGEGQRARLAVGAVPAEARRPARRRRRGDDRRAGRRAARRSTRSTSTSTASRATSTGRWTPTAARASRAAAAGRSMRREKFMNRSSYYCPRCQPRPAPALTARRRDRTVVAQREKRHDRTLGGAHRRAPLHRAQHARRRGARRVRGRRGRLHPGRADEDRAGRVQRDEQRPAAAPPARRRLPRPRSGCPGPRTASRSATRCSRSRSRSTCRGCPTRRLERLRTVVERGRSTRCAPWGGR